MDTTDVHLLRPGEVVTLLGVSRSWLYDAAKSGRIPCVRLGGPDGPVRFRLREIESWIERGRVAVASVAPVAPQRPAPQYTAARAAASESFQLRLLADGSD